MGKQVEVYARANPTEKCIKVVRHFSEGELEKVTGILRDLKLLGREDHRAHRCGTGEQALGFGA